MPITKDNWNSYKKSRHKLALDGIEEIARGPMLATAKEFCPVDEGTMRGTLTVERDDKALKVYIGGGGPAKDYIFRQHQDTSLNHPVGQAKFISQPVEMHMPKIKPAIERRVK